MKSETVTYKVNGKEFLGHLAYDSSSQNKKPAILIAHAWRGQEDSFQKMAEKFAAEGYVGFAADVFGNRTVAKNNEEATQLMGPLFINRKELRDRIGEAFKIVERLPQVDPSRIAAIGFCFGGLTVVELLRSGANVKGVVSFHGIYTNELGGKKAHLAPNEKMKGSLLVLQGALDPLVSKEDLYSLQEEMSAAKVDWQINIYANAAHAFTNPEANDVKHGLIYEPTVAKRSFKAMYNFFEEILL